MATSTMKRAHPDALSDAKAFRDLFTDCYERWEIAGSIRRGKPIVGDVEHVVIPKFGDVPDPASMFGETMNVNLLWHKLDWLVEFGNLNRHQYETHLADGGVTKRERWGEKYRGVDFRGFNNEIFLADADNWGCVLTIRTGPAEFSQRMVTALHGTMLRQQDGYLRYADGKVYPCREERDFFAACRAEWKEPRDR